MSQDSSLEGLRSQVLDSIKGRKIGLDGNGYLVGPAAYRVPVTAITSADLGGNNIPAYGQVTLQSASAGSTYAMDPPIPGVGVTLTNISTGGFAITLESGTIIQATASDITTITFTASSSGQGIRLIGLSTALFALDKPLTTGITLS